MACSLASLIYFLGMQDTALVLLGHGSSKHASSSMSVRLHADVIRRMGVFHSVHCGFLKETPLIEECLDQITAEKVVILPVFLAAGYYTQKVIPEKLQLTKYRGRVTYLKALGLDAYVQEIILEQAQRAMGEWSELDTSLVLLGHGSTKSKHSKDTLLEHIAGLRQRSKFAQITDLWLEEPPFIKDWQVEVTQKQVLFIPYLIADGQHGGWDIPQLIRIERDIYDVYKTHHVEDFQVKLTPALGKSPLMVRLIQKLTLQEAV